ncbi:Uncharacterised protein [Mycobacteroides abscessus subsp. abscessus]|nr:Uncharacterised protein [Mycobacteroides abscessus subsp. abscessus]
MNSPGFRHSAAGAGIAVSEITSARPFSALPERIALV